MKNLKQKKITTIIFLVIACLFMAESAIGSYFSMVFSEKNAEAARHASTFIETYGTATGDTASASGEAEEGAGISEALTNLANANGCDYLYLASGELTSDTAVITGTNDYSEYRKLSDTGLSAARIEKLNTKGTLTADINGSYKRISIMRPDNSGIEAGMLIIIDIKSVLLGSMQQTILLLIISMIILITLAVWIYSVFVTVNEEALNESQRKRYNPASIKRRTTAALIVSALVIFAAASFIVPLNRLFIESTNEANILAELKQRIEDDEIRNERTWKQTSDRYINEAKNIAAQLEDHPDYQNEAWLRQAAENIGANYITIYDTAGDELVSGSRYRGVSLGKDEGSATYGFRRLLRGVDNVSIAGVKDEVTGLTGDMHGISLDYLSDEKSYGALIIAVDPAANSAASYSDIEAAVSALAPVNGFISGVDPKTGIIKYSSNDKMRGSIMSEICRKLQTYEGSFMGFVSIYGDEYYVRSTEHEGIIYYCGIAQTEMFRDVLAHAFSLTWKFLLVGVLLAVIMLYGYSQKKFDEIAGIQLDSLGNKIKSKAAQVVQNASADSGNLSREQNAFMQENYLPFMGKRLTPGAKARDVFRFMVLLSTVLISLYVFIDKSGFIGSTGSTDVIDYIAHGDWEHGFNMFAIAAILFLVCLLTVGLFLLRAIAGFFYLVIEPGARTSFMLIINTIRYASIIIVVLLSLGYLGVDARALIASAGIAGVSISLGARDLIADIIAGINIIADNTYSIGDVVSIGGFRGEVAEIGMRYTKIIGRGDNIKTIRNSAIGDVINYSRLNSWYPLMLNVSTSQDLDAMESMLRKELPKIAKAHPEIVSGPEFRGIDSINGNKATILILTECKEENFNQVQRDVNREVIELFRDHNIEMF